VGIGKRIRDVMRERKISVSELARRMGVAQSTTSEMLSGNLTEESMIKIAKALECSLWDFMGPPDAPAGWVAVPVIGRVPAGVPLEAIEEYDGEILVPGGEVIGKNVIAVRVRGKSMEPSLRDGDAILVRTDVEPQNGDTVVMRVNLDGEVTCKRFYRREGTIVLQPENPAFEPMVIGVANPGEVHVIGKVIGLYRRME